MRRERSWTEELGAVKVIALPILLLIILAGYAGPQTPPASNGSNSGSFQISVDVALVVLNVAVLDRHGGFVSDLYSQSFVVYEDGVPQRIRLFRTEDIPVTVGLVVDHSTTMWPKLAEVTAAVRTFVHRSNPDDEMFVINFNEHVFQGLPGAFRFTNSTVELENAITSAPASGQTALYDAITRGLEELQAGSRDKKVLIVVSDGGDNASAHSLAQVMNLAERSSAIIYTVGIFGADNPERNPGVLKRLAKATGGKAFFPDQVGEVVASCERIAQDIRHQYTIGYVPTNLTHDRAYHAIRVVVGARGHETLSVRTRAGYRTGGEPALDEKGAK